MGEYLVEVVEQYATPAAVVSSRHVKVTDESVRVGMPTQTSASHGEARIQLVREDGVIRAIDVTCGCGDKVRIRCDYS